MFEIERGWVSRLRLRACWSDQSPTVFDRRASKDKR
jgi:hypothetical protein